MYIFIANIASLLLTLKIKKLRISISITVLYRRYKNLYNLLNLIVNTSFLSETLHCTAWNTKSAYFCLVYSIVASTNTLWVSYRYHCIFLHYTAG